MTYNFSEGPDNERALELLHVLVAVFPRMRRGDMVILALRRGLLTETEASLAMAWLTVFQGQEL